MKKIIELSGITKTYYAQKKVVQPLKELSLHVYEGEFTAITGGSGCGKTTLLNILGCLDRADSGSYKFYDTELQTLSAAGRGRFRRENIGFIFQSYNLLRELTARQNVELALKYKGVEKSKRAIFADAALKSVGMGEFADFFPDCLSGGQQQRVAAARVFACSPPLILADEPTGNLDKTNADALLSILAGMRGERTTVIMITHSLEQAAKADRVIPLKLGD